MYSDEPFPIQCSSTTPCEREKLSDDSHMLTIETMSTFIADVTMNSQEVERLARIADTLNKPIERLTPEEWENLTRYFLGVEEAIQREEQDNSVPLQDEYCWMHTDQQGGGGWSCIVCHAEQQAQKRGDRVC